MLSTSLLLKNFLYVYISPTYVGLVTSLLSTFSVIFYISAYYTTFSVIFYMSAYYTMWIQIQSMIELTQYFLYELLPYSQFLRIKFVAIFYNILIKLLFNFLYEYILQI